MSVATGTAIAIGATAAAGVAGSAIAAHEQGNATTTAANTAAQSADNTLAFNQRVYDTNLANQQPYMAAGNEAVGALTTGLANGSLTSAYPGGAFSFTPANFQQDPAYQFNRDQTMQAIQRTAAANGGLVSGGVLKDVGTFASGLAANTYQQQYTNALAAYQQAYNQFENTQSNTFNRLFNVAQLGQSAASGQAAAGANAAGVVANTNANTANTLANLYSSQGNATAAATLAGANSIAGSSNQVANILAQNQMMSGSSYSPSIMTPYRPTYPVDPRLGI